MSGGCQAWFRGRGSGVPRVFVHPFFIFGTEKGGGPRSATEIDRAVPSTRHAIHDMRLHTFPRTRRLPRAGWSADVRVVQQTAHDASSDAMTRVSVALSGPPAGSVLKNPWPDSHAADKRQDTGHPRNDSARCPEWSAPASHAAQDPTYRSFSLTRATRTDGR